MVFETRTAFHFGVLYERVSYVILLLPSPLWHFPCCSTCCLIPVLLLECFDLRRYFCDTVFCAPNMNFQQILVEIPYSEFEKNLWNVLWHIWKSPFVALCKPGFIMDQSDICIESELINDVWQIFSISEYFTYRFWIKTAKQFVVYMENPIHVKEA